MHPLSAVVLPAPGQAPPSLEDLAARPGLVVPIVVKAGTGDCLHQRGQFVEALWLKSAVLLLFEDPNEARQFEAALEAARSQAVRTWAVARPPRRVPKARGAPRPARPSLLAG